MGAKFDAAGIGPGGTLDGSSTNTPEEISDARAYIKGKALSSEDARLIRQALGIDY